MNSNKILITGMGLISAAGIGIENYNPKTEPQEITSYDTDTLDVKKAFSVGDDFDIKKYSKKIGIIRKERFSKLVVAASVDAAKDAGLEELLPSSRIGSILSTVYGPTNTVIKYLTQLEERGAGDVSANLFTQTVYNVASGQAAIQLQTQGVSSTIVGCSSINYAFDLLKDNRADIVLAVGVDELSHGVHSRDEVTKVIDPDKDIFLGEGCGVIVLEREESALKRNAKIYGEMVDYVNLSVGNMAKEYVEFDENENGVFYKSYQRLLNNNSIRVEDISCVNLVSNGIIQVEKSENASLDRIGYKGKRNIPKCVFGEAYGANEEFSVIFVLMDSDIHGIACINSLFVNGNAGLICINKR